MFSLKSKVTTKESKMEQLKNTMNELKGMEVLVGIPQANSSREGEDVTNAELLFIHTKGSPINRVPARPVIEPAIENDKDAISAIIGEAIKAALEGDSEKANNFLEQAGLEGQGASQDWFDNPENGWPPNSERTAARKREKGSTEPKPLIDTGELRKAITYVVRNRGGEK